MSDAEFSCTPPEVAEIAEEVTSNLLPTKSAGVYQASYERFLRWCNGKKIKIYSENVLIAYFSELQMKSSTKWSHYSMIRSLLSVKHGLDISKYLRLRAYLKKENEGYMPKKSKVFTKEQFEHFLQAAPDMQYLGMKVSLECNTQSIYL